MSNTETLLDFVRREAKVSEHAAVRLVGLRYRESAARESGEAQAMRKVEARLEASPPAGEAAFNDDVSAWRRWAFARCGPRRRCSDLRDSLDVALGLQYESVTLGSMVWTDDGLERVTGVDDDVVSTGVTLYEEAGVELDRTDEMARRPPVEAERSCPDDLRALGWAVAGHNDYRLDGSDCTFWLMTNDGRTVSGEGPTDAEALDEIRGQVGAAVPPECNAVLCPECKQMFNAEPDPDPRPEDHTDPLPAMTDSEAIAWLRLQLRGCKRFGRFKIEYDALPGGIDLVQVHLFFTASATPLSTTSKTLAQAVAWIKTAAEAGALKQGAHLESGTT